MSAGAFERIARRASGRAPDVERCDMCSTAVPEQHRHVIDTSTDALMCTCVACSLLFERDAASRGHYRLIPRKRRRLPDLSPAELGVPVGLAYFIRTESGAVTAQYPSPLGATSWEVPEDAWSAAVATCPVLADMTPSVEAFLVNTLRGSKEFWLVPVDDCFRLVAMIRQEWKGLSGGSTVWPAISDFFAELHENKEWRQTWARSESANPT